MFRQRFLELDVLTGIDLHHHIQHLYDNPPSRYPNNHHLDKRDPLPNNQHLHYDRRGDQSHNMSNADSQSHIHRTIPTTNRIYLGMSSWLLVQA